MSTLKKSAVAVFLAAATALASAPLADAGESTTAQHGTATSSVQTREAGRDGGVHAMENHEVRLKLLEGAVAIANEILNYIKEQIKLGANRSGLVRSMEEGAWYKTGQKYNIIVMVAPGGKTAGRFTTNFVGRVTDGIYDADGYPPFRVVAFKSGTVTNNGDGGYINWAFRGWFNRTGTNGKTVHFHLP